MGNDKRNTFAIIYRGCTSIPCDTLTRASATVDPIAKEDSWSSPVTNFRLVMISVSFPDFR